MKKLILLSAVLFYGHAATAQSAPPNRPPQATALQRGVDCGIAIGLVAPFLVLRRTTSRPVTQAEMQAIFETRRLAAEAFARELGAALLPRTTQERAKAGLLVLALNVAAMTQPEENGSAPDQADYWQSLVETQSGEFESIADQAIFLMNVFCSDLSENVPPATPEKT